VRLTQKGGGAAHIDAASLDDSPPLKVKGTEDPLALVKLSKKDFDVIDALGKKIILTFHPKGKKGKLRLTARVEPETISTRPSNSP